MKDIDDPAYLLLSESPTLQDSIAGTPSSYKRGFFRTWFATSTDIRPTSDTDKVKWGIYWYTPISILLLLLLGTASAVGHHFIYRNLHHTTVGNALRQRWTFWIGSSLSFLTKVSLTAALGLSRTQWVWLTLRRKWLTLEGIDALFGVTSGPQFLANRNMLRRAKAATFMAFLMWMFPIVAILTPGTISVVTIPYIEIVPCTVQSLVFPFDSNTGNTTRYCDDRAQNLKGISVGCWFKHPLRGWTAVAPSAVIRYFVLAGYTGLIAKPIDLPPANLSSMTTLAQKCGSNCTYAVDFVGPAVTCTKFTSWNRTDISWRNSSEFMGSMAYRSADMGRRYEFLVGANFYPLLTSRAIIFYCQKSTARYTVQLVIENRVFGEPVISKFDPIQLSDFQRTPIVPDARYLSHDSLMGVVCDLVSGNMTEQISNTKIDMTPLVKQMNDSNSNLGPVIELMAQKMVVSLLAFNETEHDVNLPLDISVIQETNCTTTEYRAVYDYSATTLLIVYGIAVVCALASSIAGFFALGQNGMASSQTVSAIIRTTRNHTLDHSFVGGSTLGGLKLSTESKKLELQFGKLKQSNGGTVSFAFGVKGEIDPIKFD